MGNIIISSNANGIITFDGRYTINLRENKKLFLKIVNETELYIDKNQVRINDYIVVYHRALYRSEARAYRSGPESVEAKKIRNYHGDSSYWYNHQFAVPPISGISTLTAAWKNANSDKISLGSLSSLNHAGFKILDNSSDILFATPYGEYETSPLEKSSKTLANGRPRRTIKYIFRLYSSAGNLKGELRVHLITDATSSRLFKNWKIRQESDNGNISSNWIK